MVEKKHVDGMVRTDHMGFLCLMTVLIHICNANAVFLSSYQ